MIVVDTNVVASLYVETASSAIVDQVLVHDAAWIAPVLWRSELRNVLAVLVRQERCSIDLALEVMESAERQLRGRDYTVPSPDVLLLAEASHCSAYDCEFVALARDLEVPLITFDRKVLEAFPELAVSPQQFVESAG